jgi:hypothetical protein
MPASLAKPDSAPRAPTRAATPAAQPLALQLAPPLVGERGGGLEVRQRRVRPQEQAEVGRQC